jgi:hypothetical protein
MAKPVVTFAEKLDESAFDTKLLFDGEKKLENRPIMGLIFMPEIGRKELYER